MVNLTFPTILTPDFLNISGLPSYDEKAVKDELNIEIRVANQIEGFNTTLEIIYNLLDAEEVKALIDFYKLTRGKNDYFYLTQQFMNEFEPSFFQALDLNTQTRWRFHTNPEIDTIYLNAYRARFELISVIEERNPSQGRYKFITPAILNLNFPKLTSTGELAVSIVKSNLSFTAPELSLNTSQTIVPSELKLNARDSNAG